MEKYNVVWSEAEVEEFYLHLMPLEKDEVFFLSMSARNKYLNSFERKFYHLGRTEMFNRKLVKQDTFVDFMRVVRSMEVAKGGYLTKNGQHIPEKCLVVYANINPSDGLKAGELFLTEIHSKLFQVTRDSEQVGMFKNLDTVMNNCYQKARGTKHFIDIDFDIPHSEIKYLEMVLEDFDKHGLQYFTVQTAGGYHVVVYVKSIGYNYTEVVKKADALYREETQMKGEIVQNTNAMIPVPGTYQAGFPVEIIGGNYAVQAYS